MEYAGRRHNVYESLIDYPPLGYRFVETQGAWDDTMRQLYSLDLLYNNAYKIINRFVPAHLVKSYLESRKQVRGSSLTFATGHLVFRDEPWVIDLEVATHLSGYSYGHLRTYRHIIERTLAKPNCKAIMPWTQASLNTILRTLNTSAFREKIRVVRHAVPLRRMHNASRSTVRILFVGSSNYNYVKDFVAKGGPEVFRIYDMLARRYDNVYLTVRSRMPRGLARRYAADRHVRIYDGILPRIELERLFSDSDIFLFPTHGTPARVFLDAMSFGLPIVTTDVWANSEYVTDGHNGVLIPKSNKIPYLTSKGFPNTFAPEFMKAVGVVDERVLKDFFTALCSLIEDTKKRDLMSRNSYGEVKLGKFSIAKRNQILGDIFDKATA